MKKLLFGVLAIFLVSCSLIQQLKNPTGILIADVNIIDVQSGEILTDRQVVIDSGKIKSISEGLENTNQYAHIINGTGKFLMPGLAEMHAHIPPPSTDAERIEEVLFLYLANGITTIRGMLGDPAHLILRENAKNGEVLSPRIFTSSPSLNGNSVTTKDEAIEKVTAYQKAGYDFLKIHPGIQRDVFDQVVETANKVGIKFAGHVPVDVGIRRALESKYASIDHVDGFLEGLVPESANAKPDENGFFGFNFSDLADSSKIDELVSLSKEKEVWIVPTQSLFTKWFAPISSEELLSLPEMKYMPASTLDNWKGRKDQSIGEGSGFNTERWEQFNAIRNELIKKLSDNGHGMLLGSDAPQLFNVPGFSIHQEMKDMAAAGMSNLEILQSGTLNPAKYFSMESVFGEVKKGLAADLILISENPLNNLDALQKISGVIHQGKWLPMSELGQRLIEIAENNSGGTAKTTDLSKKIMGSWEYFGEDGKGEDTSTNPRRIKNIYNGHWNIQQTDSKTGEVFFYHGGSYKLEGNMYIETMEYANYSTVEMIGNMFTFNMEIKDNMLTQTGVDNNYNEVWKRAD